MSKLIQLSDAELDLVSGGKKDPGNVLNHNGNGNGNGNYIPVGNGNGVGNSGNGSVVIIPFFW